MFFRLSGPGVISIRCRVLTDFLCTAANAVWLYHTLLEVPSSLT
jgi:hypothetical protein